MVVAEGHVQYAVPVYLWFDEFKRRTYAVFVNPEGMIPVLRVLSPPPCPILSHNSIRAIIGYTSHLESLFR